MHERNFLRQKRHHSTAPYAQKNTVISGSQSRYGATPNQHGLRHAGKVTSGGLLNR
jgi:hypothetical protein